jgi:hypothetical protein
MARSRGAPNAMRSLAQKPSAGPQRARARGRGDVGECDAAVPGALTKSSLARRARTPYVRGFAAWLLYDFRSERRQTGFQRGFNRKGLIAEDKVTAKPAFHVLAALYLSLGRS